MGICFSDGVGTGGGIGKYVADWIIDGEPPQELFDTDANRYENWADRYGLVIRYMGDVIEFCRKFLDARCRESYSMFYNWSYVNRPAGRPTKRVSGIYGALMHDGAQMILRNGDTLNQ